MDIEDDDIIPQTPENTKTTRKKIKSLYKTSDLVQTHLSLIGIGRTFETANKYQLHDTTINTDQNNPHVYYDIESLLQLSLNFIPRHNNTHILGYLKTYSNNFYLTNSKEETDNTCKIRLNFKLIPNIPRQDDVFSFYGSLGHEDHNNSRIPVFIVKFYRQECESFLSRYKENLRFIRNFVPTKYLDVIPL